MLRCSFLLHSVHKKKVFELFCREELLTNFSLRELLPAERRTVMTEKFRTLADGALNDLKQRASLEEARLEKLQRAAASFKALTPYEFFVKEQLNNPAIGSATNPREREVKLLQIFETLPDKAREALASRTESYNTAHSKKVEAMPLPVLRTIKRKEAPAPSSKKKAKKKKTLGKTKKQSSGGGDAKESGSGGKGREGANKTAKKKKSAAAKARGAMSPYSIFVKEQMPSLHHLAPTERMRVCGERWRSLTNEERERRLAAAREKINSAVAKSSPTPGHQEVAVAPSSAPPPSETAQMMPSESAPSTRNTEARRQAPASPASSSSAPGVTPPKS